MGLQGVGKPPGYSIMFVPRAHAYITGMRAQIAVFVRGVRLFINRCDHRNRSLSGLRALMI
jgi:hypothetical protein